MNLLTLSGSLRRDSANTALLQALADVAPASFEVRHFDGLRDLPLFNPDTEEQQNAAVSAFRVALAWADGVAISSPEYAHGIPGAFKNALDWVVGSAEFDGLPTLLLCASARPQHAPAHLAEVLRTMGAKVCGPHALDLPRGLAEAQTALRDEEKRGQLRECLTALSSV